MRIHHVVGGLWVAGFLAIAIVCVAFAFTARAQPPTGPELAIEFAFCGHPVGWDPLLKRCWGWPEGYVEVDEGDDLIVWIDARRLPSEHPHELLEVELFVTYERASFASPRAVRSELLEEEPALWDCDDDPSINPGLPWGRARCRYVDLAGGSAGMPVYPGAELGVALEAVAPGMSTFAFEPQPGTSCCYHRNEVTGLVWRNGPEDEEGTTLLYGSWRQVGEQHAVEVMPAPEPSAASLLAAGGALLASLYRRRVGQGRV